MAAGDEFLLIDEIRRKAATSRRTPLELGIGDDAAVIRVGAGANVLVTVDVLTEGVHFDLGTAGPEAVGRKALAVNLSDIAAMAGHPTAAVVGLVLPKRRGDLLARGLMDGLFELATEYEVDVVGGDTNVWDGPLVVSVTLLGTPSTRGVVTRGGARPGDWLFVTGALGGSLGGRHLAFEPRVREALALHAAMGLHAMIDLSDGLASDARHIAHESAAGLLIDAAAVPIHDDVDDALSAEQRLAHALGDGEDFELLFAVSAEDGRRLLEESPIGVPLTRIGEVTSSPECLLKYADGRTIPLPEAGWVHRFANS